MIAVLAIVALIGLFVLSGVLNISGFFEALPVLLLLAAIGVVTILVVRANFDPAWSGAAGIAAPASVLAWAAWRPALSSRKLWVMFGAHKAMSSVTWLSLLAFAVTLPLQAFRLDDWVRHGRYWLALAAVAWCFGRLTQEIVVRSGQKNLGKFKENLTRLD